MLPRSEPVYVFGMESSDRLILVYSPSTKVVKVIRCADFQVPKDSKLPDISPLIDGISRQASIEPDEAEKDKELNAEEHCRAARNPETPPLRCRKLEFMIRKAHGLCRSLSISGMDIFDLL